MTKHEKIEVNEYGLGSPRAQELLAAARAMGPALRERRERASRDQRVPDETVQEMQDAGFFKILQPEKWGGYAMDPQVFYAVGLEVARNCPSSAWILGVIAVHNWQLALFDDQAAQDVWAEDPGILISSSYAPVGKVEVVDGGFRLSGRWSFSSGSEHCKWAFLGAVVPTPDAPFDMGNYRTFLVPIEDYEIVHNWEVVGLQGTGSHDIVVDNAFVPEHRTHKSMDGFLCDNPGNAVNDAPLYRMPFMRRCTVCLSCRYSCARSALPPSAPARVRWMHLLKSRKRVASDRTKCRMTPLPGSWPPRSRRRSRR
jgi:3-hydroxy-9,10-secoandrosta-1,3,5(10)-triene-9,17-dione monooxygenase